MNLWDNDLMKYLKEDLPKECLTEYSMEFLLDLEEAIEMNMNDNNLMA